MTPNSSGQSKRGLTGSQFVLLGLCLGIMGLTRVPWSQWVATHDLVICEFLEQTYAEFQELRDRNASDDEWQQFVEQTTTAAAPHVRELSRSATSMRPVRQRLLFLTRDHLPKLLGTARQQPTQAEDKFLEMLEEVRTMLEGDLPDSMQVLGDESM